MNTLYLLDPTPTDKLSSYRGGGRVIQLIRDYLKDTITFINDARLVPVNGTLIVPYWFPYHLPQIITTRAHAKVLIIFDVIPLKYPEHFPIGIKGELFKFINCTLARGYDRILTISNSSKGDIVKHLRIDPSKITVFPLTVAKSLNTTKESKPNDIELEKPFCLYVGDVNWNKNLPNLARGVIDSGVTCVCVGRPFSSANRTTIAQSNSINPALGPFREFIKITHNSNKFIFPENVSDAELVWLYKHAVCNILPSYDEGFGLSYLEAASYETPSVLSDISVFHEIARDSALFVDPEKPKSISDAITLLSTNAQRRQDLGKKAKERSVIFSPEKFKDHFQSSINDL